MRVLLLCKSFITILGLFFVRFPRNLYWKLVSKSQIFLLALYFSTRKLQFVNYRTDTNSQCITLWKRLTSALLSRNWISSRSSCWYSRFSWLANNLSFPQISLFTSRALRMSLFRKYYGALTIYQWTLFWNVCIILMSLSLAQLNINHSD